MRLPNGKAFTIVADGLDDRHTYVGNVSLNGKPRSAPSCAMTRSGRWRAALQHAGRAEQDWGRTRRRPIR